MSCLNNIPIPFARKTNRGKCPYFALTFPADVASNCFCVWLLLLIWPLRLICCGPELTQEHPLLQVLSRDQKDVDQFLGFADSLPTIGLYCFFSLSDP